jgi:hypothetical protein
MLTRRKLVPFIAGGVALVCGFLVLRNDPSLVPWQVDAVIQTASLAYCAFVYVRILQGISTMSQAINTRSEVENYRIAFLGSFMFSTVLGLISSGSSSAGSASDWWVLILVLFSLALLLNLFIIIYRIIRAETLLGSWDIIQAVPLVFIAVGVTFAGLYRFIPNSVTGANSTFDFLYFSFTALSTIDSGDLVPNNQYAKVLTVVESFIGNYGLLGILVAGAFTLPSTVKRNPPSPVANAPSPVVNEELHDFFHSLNWVQSV